MKINILFFQMILLILSTSYSSACDFKEIQALKSKIRLKGADANDQDLTKILSYSIYKDCDHIVELKPLIKKMISDQEPNATSVLGERKKLIEKRFNSEKNWNDINSITSELKIKSINVSNNIFIKIDENERKLVDASKDSEVLNRYQKEYCEGRPACIVSWQDSKKNGIQIQSYTVTFGHLTPIHVKKKTIAPTISKINSIKKKGKYSGKCPVIGENKSQECFVDLKEKIVLDYKFVGLEQANVACAEEEEEILDKAELKNNSKTVDSLPLLDVKTILPPLRSNKENISKNKVIEKISQIAKLAIEIENLKLREVKPVAQAPVIKVIEPQKTTPKSEDTKPVVITKNVIEVVEETEKLNDPLLENPAIKDLTPLEQKQAQLNVLKDEIIKISEKLNEPLNVLVVSSVTPVSMFKYKRQPVTDVLYNIINLSKNVTIYYSESDNIGMRGDDKGVTIFLDNDIFDPVKLKSSNQLVTQEAWSASMDEYEKLATKSSLKQLKKAKGRGISYGYNKFNGINPDAFAIRNGGFVYAKTVKEPDFILMITDGIVQKEAILKDQNSIAGCKIPVYFYRPFKDKDADQYFNQVPRPGIDKVVDSLDEIPRYNEKVKLLQEQKNLEDKVNAIEK